MTTSTFAITIDVEGSFKMVDAILRPLIDDIARLTARFVIEELRSNPIIKPRWTDTKGAAAHLDCTETIGATPE